MLLLGAHLSIAGGLHRAVERAGTLKCNCLQVFVRNQRQWRAKALSHDAARRWRESLRSSDPTIVRVIAHSSYLINLASDRGVIRRRSVVALRDEMERCQALGIDRLVLHPGSHRGQGLAKGISQVVAGLDRVLACTEKTRILLETTSGAGFTMGSRLEELAEIIDRCERADRLGCCLDTCHLFAAGYVLADKGDFDRLIRQIDGLFGLGRIECIHLNDSLGELGSGRDRHVHIGRGRIGLDAFRRVLIEPALSDVPKIIETPKSPGNSLYADRRNLAVLRRLADENRSRRTLCKVPGKTATIRRRG